jgi:hypothetical protein
MCCNTFASTFAQLHTAVIYLELEQRLVQVLTCHHHCALLASAFESFIFPVTIGGSTPQFQSTILRTEKRWKTQLVQKHLQIFVDIRTLIMEQAKHITTLL